MASFDQFFTQGVSSQGTVSANPATPGSPVQAETATDLAKNIVVAWTVLFVSLGLINIAVKRLGR